MRNEFQEIRGLMRYGYLSTTGRGLTQRLDAARRSAGSKPAAANLDLSSTSTISGISTLLLVAWQLGYGI